MAAVNACSRKCRAKEVTGIVASDRQEPREAAIEKLRPAELCELITWIEDYAAVIGGSEALFAMYYAEEEQTRAESEAR